MKEALFADQCSAFGLGEASAIKVDSARFSTCCSKAFAFDEICCGSLKSWQDHAKTRTASEGIRSVRNKGVISLLRSTLYIRVMGPKEVLSPKSLEPDLKVGPDPSHRARLGAFTE